MSVRRRRKSHRALAGAGLVALLIAGACTSSKNDASPSTTTAGSTSTTSDEGTSTTDPSSEGAGPNLNFTTAEAAGMLKLRLSQGAALAAAVGTGVEVVDGTALDEARVAEILARLPEWVNDPDLAEAFKWPAATLTPPRTGTIVDTPFPPPPDDTAPPAVDPGPLEVLRHQPDGDVALAPYLSLTFNQPMVPVGTLDQLDALDVPVTISPAVEGRWQWIGTRTLRFDAASTGTPDSPDRLPMATEYTVTVPKGTKSPTGGELADDAVFTFATPAPVVQSFTPATEYLRLDTVFVAAFDQLVDPAAVLATIKLTAGDQAREIRLATDAEIAASTDAQLASSGARPGRWVAFRAVDALPADTAIKVEIGPGTPSAEGPRTTTEATSFNGRTYAPLKVVSSGCGGPCYPGGGFGIQLNNPLDAAKFDGSAITFDPVLPGSAVYADGGSGMYVNGVTKGNTTYKVTLPADLTDAFGQTLGEDTTVEVRVGPAQPAIGQLQPLVTLDPLAETQSLSVRSVKHSQLKVRAYRVTPADFPAFSKYVMEVNQGPGGATPQLPKWEQVIDTTVDVEGADDTEVETVVDLAGALDGKAGHAVVIVEPTEDYPPSSELYWSNRPIITWVQATSLGLDAAADGKRLSAWVTDLRTGAPIAGVAVSAGGQELATTDDTGRALVDRTTNIGVLTAAKDGETAILASGYFGDEWYFGPTTDQASWYVVDDRGIYKPGETASIKGWVRRLATSTDARLKLLDAGAKVSWRFNDAQGVEIATGEAELNPLGGFTFTIEMPDGVNLGPGGLQLSLVGGGVGGEWYHPLQVEEFRTPEFEVTARTESPAPQRANTPATLAVDANYYAGGPLAAAPVAWQVSTTEGSYSPPNLPDWTFGIWTPWWFDNFGGGARSFPPFGGPGVAEVEQFAGTTDAAGHHFLQVDFEGTDGQLPDLPVNVSAQATVTDVNRQAWSASTTMLVHPSSLYVGLRSTRTFVKAGDPLEVEAIVTDVDGNRVAGRVFTVVAERMEWGNSGGTWAERPVSSEACETTSTETDPVVCTFGTEVGGTYRITARIADDEGGRNRTQLTRWVSGGNAVPNRNLTAQQLTVIPDAREYAPGDTAELLVLAPFSPAEGLATITRNGILRTERFTIADGSAVLSLPLTDAEVPNIDVQLEVVGTSPRMGDDGKPLDNAPPQPAYAVGSQTITVTPTTRTLAVTATPEASALMPGETTSIDLAVTRPDGSPAAGAELAVVVVDEAVLSLTGYQITDPLDVFYTQLYTNLYTRNARDTIILSNPAVLAGRDQSTAGGLAAPAATEAAAAEMAPVATTAAADVAFSAPVPAGARMAAGADGDAAKVGGTPIGVRTDFSALALFEPSVTTDAQGKAKVDFTLPDNLTRYRVMVVAADGAERFGSSEATITARLPLMVRPSAPRFANFGDVFELPVVVQNQTDAAMTVDVALQTDNLDITGADGAPVAGPVGKQVSVPANDRVEVRFPVAAASAGTARFRVAGVDAGASTAADAATVELPVYTPATAEAFATYGTIDDGATIQPLLAPTGVIPQFGGLEVTTSSTALQALTDAVIYLADYPYESSDAMASRIIGIASLRDVLDAFDADGLPPADALNEAVKADLAGLARLQEDDGGFAYWQRYRGSDPYNTVQATHAIVLAKEMGYQVDADVLARAMSYLADIESHIPSDWPDTSKRTVRAYAINVRALNGDRDPAKAEALWNELGDNPPLDAVAWIWPSIDDAGIDSAIGRLLANRAVETAGAANFSSGYTDADWVVLHSDRRTDALVLDALISKQPTSDLIAKTVTGLLGHRVAGRWDNVQENAFVLLALKKYFDTYENVTPDFVARVWLGDRFAGESTFQGRSTDSARVSVPTAELIAAGAAGAGTSNIVVGKEGAGRLYYRMGLRYAPESLSLESLDRGFVVERTYEGVDNPDDVRLDDQGIWHVKAGARVRVKLTMVAESQRTRVALIDPLPAGFEIVNGNLANTQDLPPTPSEQPVIEGDVAIPAVDFEYRGWWWGTWYEHENLRTDRAEAFAGLLPAGTYDYTYVARATTPGTFVTPPTRAEEIYAPETFGRTATAKVIVEP